MFLAACSCTLRKAGEATPQPCPPAALGSHPLLQTGSICPESDGQTQTLWAPRPTTFSIINSLRCTVQGVVVGGWGGPAAPKRNGQVGGEMTFTEGTRFCGLPEKCPESEHKSGQAASLWGQIAFLMNSRSHRGPPFSPGHLAPRFPSPCGALPGPTSRNLSWAADKRQQAMGVSPTLQVDQGLPALWAAGAVPA